MKLIMNRVLKLFIAFAILGLLSNPVLSNNLEYDYSDTYSIPIRLSPIKEISTREQYIPGESIKLKVLSNVYHNGKLILKSGDMVNAKLEMSITSGMNGFPAELIVDDFDIPGIKQSQIVGTYRKTGQNRCLIVYPIKLALTPIPFVGSLTNFIKGGHAKIRTTDEIVVNYYPNWK